MSLRDTLTSDKARERYDRNYYSIELTLTVRELEEHDLELLDKVAKKIKEYSGMHYVDCDGYFGGEKELIFNVDNWLDEVIAELKAEVSK